MAKVDKIYVIASLDQIDDLSHMNYKLRIKLFNEMIDDKVLKELSLYDRNKILNLIYSKKETFWMSYMIFRDPMKRFNSPYSHHNVTEMWCSIKNIIKICDCDIVGKLLFLNNINLQTKIHRDLYKTPNFKFSYTNLKECCQISPDWSKFIIDVLGE